MKTTDLNELLVTQMKNLYSMEWQLLSALPQMVAAATHPELKAALGQQLVETQTHVQRLESTFDLMGRSPQGQACKTVEGILSEAQEDSDEGRDTDLVDADILTVAHQIGHHKLAGYECALGYATTLGNDDAKSVLQDAWDQGFAASKTMVDLAGRAITLEPDEEEGDLE